MTLRAALALVATGAVVGAVAMRVYDDDALGRLREAAAMDRAVIQRLERDAGVTDSAAKAHMAAVPGARAGTDAALARAITTARRGETRGAGRTGESPVPVAPPVVSGPCDCEAVAVALVKTERALVLERAVTDSALAALTAAVAVRDTLIERLAAAHARALAVRELEHRRERRRLQLQVWTARVGAVGAAAAGILVGRMAR